MRDSPKLKLNKVGQVMIAKFPWGKEKPPKNTGMTLDSSGFFLGDFLADWGFFMGFIGI